MGSLAFQEPVDPLDQFELFLWRAVHAGELMAAPVEDECRRCLDRETLPQGGLRVYVHLDHLQPSRSPGSQVVHQRLHHAAVSAPFGPEFYQQKFRPVADLLIEVCGRDRHGSIGKGQRRFALAAEGVVLQFLFRDPVQGPARRTAEEYGIVCQKNNTSFQRVT
jgi:hypothetical protein